MSSTSRSQGRQLPRDPSVSLTVGGRCCRRDDGPPAKCRHPARITHVCAMTSVADRLPHEDTMHETSSVSGRPDLTPAQLGAEAPHRLLVMLPGEGWNINFGNIGRTGPVQCPLDLGAPGAGCTTAIIPTADQTRLAAVFRPDSAPATRDLGLSGAGSGSPPSAGNQARLIERCANGRGASTAWSCPPCRLDQAGGVRNRAANAHRPRDDAEAAASLPCRAFPKSSATWRKGAPATSPSSLPSRRVTSNCGRTSTVACRNRHCAG